MWEVFRSNIYADFWFPKTMLFVYVWKARVTFRHKMCIDTTLWIIRIVTAASCLQMLLSFHFLLQHVTHLPIKPDKIDSVIYYLLCAHIVIQIYHLFVCNKVNGSNTLDQNISKLYKNVIIRELHIFQNIQKDNK